jgi:hypothetical protein
MRIHAEEIQEMYREFLKAQKNQIEIFMALRKAFIAFSSLETFVGDGAAAAKAYIADVHVSVVDSFNSALMELETRMLLLEQDFRASVDSSDVAIIDAGYIRQSFLGKFVPYRDEYKRVHRSGENAIAGIGFLGLPPWNVNRAEDYFELAEHIAREKTLKAMGDGSSGFIGRHAHDLSEIEGTFFPAIDNAIAYMRSLRKNGKISYAAGDVSEYTDSWYGDLNAYNLAAYLYASKNDPAFYDTLYLAIAADTCEYLHAIYLMKIGDESGFTYEDLLKILHGGDFLSTVAGTVLDATQVVDGSDELVEFIRLVRTGLKYEVNTNEYGNVFLNIVSASGKELTNAQRLKALERAGVDISNIKTPTLNKMFSAGGICVWSENQTYTRVFNGIDENWQAFSNLKTAINSEDVASDALGKAGALLKKLGSAADVAGKIGYGLDFGVDLADACYDDRTQKLGWENIDPARLAGAFTIDGLQIAAVVGANIMATAAAGSVVPIAGTIAGAIVGVVLGVLNIVEYGEPPESVMDHLKDWVGDGFDDIGNAFQKWFG